jgi:nucleoid-associated protein YgaU
VAAEPPKAEAPQAEAPKVEAPKAEAPKVEAPAQPAVAATPTGGTPIAVWALVALIVPLVWFLGFKKGVITFFLLFVVGYALLGRGEKQKQE